MDIYLDYIKKNVPHLLLNDLNTEYNCSPGDKSKYFSFLHKLVMETRKHKILEEYLKIYLQTKKGKNELDLKNTKGWTPLMLSCRNFNTDSTPETVKILIENKANLDLQTNYGSTALMFACNNPNADSSLEIVKLLIENNANLDLLNNNSNTALTFACYYSDTYNSLEIIKLLIKNKANLYLEDNMCNTALIYLLNKNNNIFEFLEYYKNIDATKIEQYIKLRRIPIINYDLLIENKIIKPIISEYYKNSKYNIKICIPLRILEIYKPKISECMICIETKRTIICDYKHATCYSCLDKVNYKCQGCQLFL